MSNAATRRKRFTAGVLAGALAVSVMPIFGFTGVAGALEEPTGDGSVCEDPPEQEPFIDVTDTDPGKEEIECLVNTEITVGTTPTSYSPNNPVTRRQMALFLARLADAAENNEVNNEVTELPAPDGDTPFADIEDESAEVQAAVDRLNEAGIAQGTSATQFSPAATVTRRQMANFIVRLQEFLAGEDITPDNPADAFDDDEGDPGEDALNVLAAEGVFLGDGQGNVNPGDNISRRQMAFVIVRTLQYFFENDVIQRLFEDDDTQGANQTFTVAGNTEGRDLGPDGARTCVVTGLTAGGTYDAALFPSEDVRIDANGRVTFTDANGDSLADNEGNTPTAAIVNVNGAPVNPPNGQPEVNNVVAPTGALSVTIAGAVVPDDVTLVVWQDNPGFTGNALDLEVPSVNNTNPKAPRESFGVGCRTLFANEAPGGAFGPVPVASTDKTANLFTAGGNNFFYDANDVFQIGGVPQAAGEAGLAAFEARLSPGDQVSGTYATDPAGVSTFNLTDAAPLAPAGATATSSGTTVTLQFNESATPTADAYNIYRIVRPASGVCPNFDTAGSTGRGQFPTAPTATQPDPTPSAAGGTMRTFTDTGLAPNTFYCYAVTTVDEGDESATSAQATVQTTAQGTAPVINDVRAFDGGTVGIVDAGDVHQFIFSEPMNATIDDAGQLYRIQDADGSVSEIVCGTNAACALQGAGTYNGTALPANQVLRVTVNGAVNAITGFLGTTPGLQYPVTITNVSAGWDDAGGTQLDLAGSPDKVVNVDTITPTIVAADLTRPNIQSSVADESADTVVLTYTEPVLCDATAAAQFRYTDANNAAPGVAPTGITCNGTATVTLTFADGAIAVADATPNINYTDDNAAVVDANDVRDLAGNQAQTTDNSVPTVVA